jgi:hypothetical protein
MVETSPFSCKETNMACCTNDYTPSIPAEKKHSMASKMISSGNSIKNIFKSLLIASLFHQAIHPLPHPNIDDPSHYQI